MILCAELVPFKRFLVYSSASTMHAYFVLRVPEELQVSPCLLLLILHDMAAGILLFLWVRYHFFSIESSGVDF